MPPKTSKTASKTLKPDVAYPGEPPDVAPSKHSIEERKTPEIVYKETQVLDDEILFDSHHRWKSMDRTVYELYKSMFPEIVEHLMSRPAEKTRVVAYDPNEERTEDQGLPSPVTSIHDHHIGTDRAVNGDDFSSPSVNFEEVSESGTDLFSLVELPYRKRLEVVRKMIDDHGGDFIAIGETLVMILMGEQVKPMSLQRIHQSSNLSERDQEVDLLFTNGNRYIGRLSRYCLEGSGRFQFANGASYEGNFTNNTLSGKGRLEWPDMSWYEGDFVNNRRHGMGTFKSSSGMVYCGFWAQGQRHGTGRQYYDCGDKNYYEGSFHHNARWGEGTRYWEDGQRYTGAWERDVRHGFGVMRFKDATYRGMWREGQMSGDGAYTWGETGHACLLLPREYNVYSGGWKAGLRHGEGLLKTAGGMSYRGIWYKGKKEEKGFLCRGHGQVLLEVESRNDTMYVLKKDQSFGDCHSE